MFTVKTMKSPQIQNTALLIVKIAGKYNDHQALKD
jgi:hypothetical protein